MRDFNSHFSLPEDTSEAPYGNRIISSSNSWSMEPPRKEGRPSSNDGVWGMHQPNIWGDSRAASISGSGGNSMTFHPEILQNPVLTPDRSPNQTFVNHNRQGSFGDSAITFSPKDFSHPDYFRLDTSSLSFDMQSRRHSTGESYYSLNNLFGKPNSNNQGLDLISVGKRAQYQPSPNSKQDNHTTSHPHGPQQAPASQGPSQIYHASRQSSTKLNKNNFDEANSTRQTVEDYFYKDLHQRVKVNVTFVNEKFPQELKYMTEATHLPKFPSEYSPKKFRLMVVAFKAGRVDVFHASQKANALNGLKVGDLVIVEADRGRDLGMVVKLDISLEEARYIKLLHVQEQQAALSDSDDSELSIEHLQSSNQALAALHLPKAIIGVAQSNEIAQIISKSQDEEKACKLCLTKISNSSSPRNSQVGLGNSLSTGMANSDLMQMKLIDAEYQFDRRKLIYYYATNKRIDFRELVRELFRIHKTRIWMCAVVRSKDEGKEASKAKLKSKMHFTGSSYEKFDRGQQNIEDLPFPHSQAQSSSVAMSQRGLEESFRGNFHIDQYGASKQEYSQERLSQMNAFKSGQLTPQVQVETSFIPRKFMEEGKRSENSREEEEVRNTESLVLGSLVDSINH